MSEPTELERLRARVAELEAELAAQAPAAEPPAPPGEAARPARWRSVVSGILVVLAATLAPVSVASVWASTVLNDTDQYVDTVAPLADDPDVQQAIANQVTTAIFENLDVQGLTTQALAALATRPNVPPRVGAALPQLATPISNGIESYTRTQVNKIVASPRFAAAWDQVNRIAHDQLLKLLRGEQGGAITAQGDTITLNLAPIIQMVKEQLVAQGFGLASRIPTVNKSFVLVQSQAIPKAQGYYQALTTLGIWLPIVLLVLFVAGVLLAHDRRRALLRGALGVAGAMVLLGVGLALVRVAYLNAVPPEVLSRQAAGTVFDTLVRFLRTSLRTVAVLGIVVALGAVVAGPSAAAVWTRSTATRGIGFLRGGAEAHGWRTGRFGSWVYAQKRWLRLAVLIAGGLVLAFWSQPTVWTVVGVLLVVLLVLAVIEFLGRPPATPGPGVSGPEAPVAKVPPATPSPQATPGPGSSPEGEAPHRPHRYA